MSVSSSLCFGSDSGHLFCSSQRAKEEKGSEAEAPEVGLGNTCTLVQFIMHDLLLYVGWADSHAIAHTQNSRPYPRLIPCMVVSHSLLH